MSNNANELLFRHPNNPIITRDMFNYKINTVFNAAASKLNDSTVVLLLRVEDRRGISHLTVAKSKNGIDNWEIDNKPTILPEPDKFPEELWGIEDARSIYIPELKKFAITYTSYSIAGPVVSLAFTKDFEKFEKFGVIMPPEDKDAALFPRKFNDKWILIHRPVPSQSFGAHIWISYSPDLTHWGEHKIIIKAREGSWWDANRVGLATPPIETKEGWLILYHGVKKTVSGAIYRVGLALLDLDDPSKLIKRSSEWIFSPTQEYELIGDVNNVVFPCGYVIDEDTNNIKLYYGAADSSICLATANIDQLVEWLLNE